MDLDLPSLALNFNLVSPAFPPRNFYTKRYLKVAVSKMEILIFPLIDFHHPPPLFPILEVAQVKTLGVT